MFQTVVTVTKSREATTMRLVEICLRFLFTVPFMSLAFSFIPTVSKSHRFDVRSMSTRSILSFDFIRSSSRYNPDSQLSSSKLNDNNDDDDFNYKSINKSATLTSGNKMPSSKGDFFEEAPSTTPKQKEEEPMTLKEFEMLATPFDEHLPTLNVVTLVGRVGSKPEPRYFDDGKVVLNLSLAVKRKYHPLERKVRNIRYGEEETDWFPLEFWGRDAEYVNDFVEKGARLGITGSLVVDGWVDKVTGDQRRRAKVLVKHIDILESRVEAESRRSNRESDSTGRRGAGQEENDYGPSPAGTGGFFDT